MTLPFTRGVTSKLYCNISTRGSYHSWSGSDTRLTHYSQLLTRLVMRGKTWSFISRLAFPYFIILRFISTPLPRSNCYSCSGNTVHSSSDPCWWSLRGGEEPGRGRKVVLLFAGANIWSVSPIIVTLADHFLSATPIRTGRRLERKCVAVCIFRRSS